MAEQSPRDGYVGSATSGPTLPRDTLAQWQSIVDTMAEIVDVPAGLIMRLNGEQIEVCVASRTASNPYIVGEAEHFAGSGLYCECVLQDGKCLVVPNAREDPVWQDNPDVPRGMIAYLGFPIRWPDLSPFGTICVLDNKANAFSLLYERLVEQFRDVIEHHLRLITHQSDRQRMEGFGRAELAAALESNQGRLRTAQAELYRLQRQSTVNRFAGAVVHEMNQPIAAIGFSAAAALRWLAKDEPDVPAARAAVRRLTEASRRAVDIMVGLGAMANDALADAAVFDLHAVVREMAMMLREDAAQSRINIRIRLSRGTDLVFGNRAQIQIVLHNIVRNAIEAMAGAGSSVRRELSIGVSRAESGCIQLAVEDNGTGIDVEAMERIFRTAFTTKATGMGLGLGICRDVVEANGGTISAANRADGSGAVFTFTLPAADAAAHE
jgi:two-component system, sensor histidine kinase